MSEQELLGAFGAVAVVVALGVLWMVLTVLVWYIIQVIANWKIFNKAGEPGWKSIIPLYNTYTAFKISWKTSMFWIWLAATVLTGFFDGLNENGGGILGILSFIFGIVCLIILIVFEIKMAKSFGKGIGFAIGLIILNPIFILILGFGSARYLGPEGGTGASGADSTF